VTMAPLTESNIHQHELMWLSTLVVSSSNPSQVGIKGRLVDETMRTITVSDGGKERMIQKKGTCFEFTLPNGSTVVVEGRRIADRPIERVKARKEAH